MTVVRTIQTITCRDSIMTLFRHCKASSLTRKTPKKTRYRPYREPLPARGPHVAFWDECRGVEDVPPFCGELFFGGMELPEASRGFGPFRGFTGGEARGRDAEIFLGRLQILEARAPGNRIKTRKFPDVSFSPSPTM